MRKGTPRKIKPLSGGHTAMGGLCEPLDSRIYYFVVTVAVVVDLSPCFPVFHAAFSGNIMSPARNTSVYWRAPFLAETTLVWSLLCSRLSAKGFSCIISNPQFNLVSRVLVFLFGNQGNLGLKSKNRFQAIQLNWHPCPGWFAWLQNPPSYHLD